MFLDLGRKLELEQCSIFVCSGLNFHIAGPGERNRKSIVNMTGTIKMERQAQVDKEKTLMTNSKVSSGSWKQPCSPITRPSASLQR